MPMITMLIVTFLSASGYRLRFFYISLQGCKRNVIAYKGLLDLLDCYFI